MAEKIYLNVPYAQKDAAKALGARWDPATKKWYVPAGKDMAPFAHWLSDVTALPKPVVSSGGLRLALAATSSGAGVFIHASTKDFVAYSDSAPPWD